MKESFEMTHEKRSESEGSEHPIPFPRKRDSAEREQLRPFKKRTRFFTNDESESSGARRILRKVPSMSSLTDAGEEHKMKNKRSTCTTSESQLAIRQSAGGFGNEGWGDVDEIQAKETKDVIEHSGGSSSGSATGAALQAAAMNDGADENIASSGEKPIKRRIIYIRRRPKQIRAPEEIPVDDESAPEEERDFSDQILPAERVTKPEEDGDAGKIDGGGADANGKEGMVPQGADDSGGDAPDVGGDEELVPEADGGKREDGGGAFPPTDTTVEIKGDMNSEADEAQEAAEEDAPDGSDAPGGDEPSKEGDNESEGEEDGGADSFSLTNTISESNNGGSGEGNGEEQGEQAVVLEDDGDANNNNNPPGNEEESEEEEEDPLDYEIGQNCRVNYALGIEDHEREMEEADQKSSICTAGSDDNGGGTEADSHEQQQQQQQQPPVAMEDGGNENIANSHPGAEEETNNGENPVEGDDHEQEQQQAAATEDGRDGNSRDVVVISGEEGVPDGSHKAPDLIGDEEQVNQADQETNPEADGDGDNGDQMQQAAMLVPDDDDDGDNDDQAAMDPLDGDGDEQIQQAAMEVPDDDDKVDQAAMEVPDDDDKDDQAAMDAPDGDGDEQIQQAAMDVPDDDGDNNDQAEMDVLGDGDKPIQEAAMDVPEDETGNKNADAGEASDDANTGAYTVVEDEMETQKDPDPVSSRKRSSQEVIVVSDDEDGGEQELARKKIKKGSDGGSSSAAGLVVQQANNPFQFPIPCEKESDDVPINTSNAAGGGGGGESGVGSPVIMQRPADGIRLFGAYISQQHVQPAVAVRGIQLFGVYITGEQVQPVAMQNGGGGNCDGDGEQRAKTGVRLFGTDIY